MAAAVALAAVGATSPSAGFALLGFGLLFVIPIELLISLFIAVAIVSFGHGIPIGAFNILPSQIVIVPLAVRVLSAREGAGLRSTTQPWETSEWLLAMWVLLAVLSSAMHALDVRASLVATGELAIAALSFVTMLHVVHSPSRLRSAARVALLTAATATLFGVIAVAVHQLGIDLLDSFLAGRPGTRQAVSSLPKGLSVENNIYGSVAASTSIAFLVLLREHAQVIRRKWAITAFAICTLGTFLSATRAAWIAYVMGAMAFALFRHRRTTPSTRSVAPLVTVIVPACFAAIVFILAAQPSHQATQGDLTGSIAESASGLLDFGSGTGAGRVGHWRQAIADLPASPFFGLGANSYGQRHFVNGQPALLGNVYIRTLHDTGIIGLAVYLGFLGSVVWPRRWLFARVSEAATIARAAIFASVVFAIAFMATDASFQPWPWIILSLARAASRVAQGETAQTCSAYGRR